jgi:5'-methylthioadenosine phosphorylase
MLGIIGGSGLYALKELELLREHDFTTPFGKPSAPITEGKVGSKHRVFPAPAWAQP